MSRKRTLIGTAAAAATLLVVSVVAATMASPASGITPTVLSRGTFDAFKVATYPAGAGMFKAEAKDPIDLVVRKHEYAPGASTGWHAHPNPVFITVISGTLTFYKYDDPTCTPIVVTAGHGYVDDGRGHIGRNESTEPATDISVILAPVGGAFRTELPAPGPYCTF
jgi:Cupin domain